MTFKKALLYAYAGGLVLVPLVLILLPAGFFDTGKTVCLSILFFDFECHGCGITRAIQHLIHLDFEKAMMYNKLSFIVLPLLMYVWFTEVRQTYYKIKNTIAAKVNSNSATD